MKTKKPRSKLQQVTTQAHHAIYFSLHKFFPHELDKIVISMDTWRLLTEYNKLTGLLKESIRKDSDITKQLIRHYDKKKLDSKP